MAIGGPGRPPISGARYGDHLDPAPRSEAAIEPRDRAKARIRRTHRDLSQVGDSRYEDRSFFAGESSGTSSTPLITVHLALARAIARWLLRCDTCHRPTADRGGHRHGSAGARVMPRPSAHRRSIAPGHRSSRNAGELATGMPRRDRPDVTHRDVSDLERGVVRSPGSSGGLRRGSPRRAPPATHEHLSGAPLQTTSRFLPSLQSENAACDRSGPEPPDHEMHVSAVSQPPIQGNAKHTSITRPS